MSYFILVHSFAVVQLLSFVGKTAVPSEFDNEVMSMLKDFTKNVNKESRISQPALEETWK